MEISGADLYINRNFISDMALQVRGDETEFSNLLEKSNNHLWKNQNIPTSCYSSTKSRWIIKIVAEIIDQSFYDLSRVKKHTKPKNYKKFKTSWQ